MTKVGRSANEREAQMRKAEVTVLKQAGVQMRDVGIAKYSVFEAENFLA